MKTHNDTIKLMLLLLAIFQSSNLMASEAKVNDLADTLSATQLVSAVLDANPRLDIAKATWQASLARDFL